MNILLEFNHIKKIKYDKKKLLIKRIQINDIKRYKNKVITRYNN